MNEVVTVGIPFCSETEDLVLAVASVRSQTMEAWRLVLVADGATDSALRLAKKLCDGRIALWNDGERRGLAARLNELSRDCETRYLARMDADDVMHPSRLERQVTHLEQHPTCQLVGTGAYVMDERNQVYGVRQTAELTDTAAAVVRNDFLIHPSVLGRSAWFRGQPYDESYRRSQDKELWCRTWGPGRFSRIPEPLLFFRSPRSISWPKYSASCAMDRRLMRVHGTRLVGRPTAWWRIGASFGKQALAWTAIRAGRDDVLVRGRSCQLLPTERERGQRILDEIAASGRELLSAMAEAETC